MVTNAFLFASVVCVIGVGAAPAAAQVPLLIAGCTINLNGDCHYPKESDDGVVGRCIINYSVQGPRPECGPE